MIKVCEHKIECCPYCRSVRIKEMSTDMRGHLHEILCERCGNSFLVPCED